MKTRPILYSAPMVRAIIDDTKTKTRRIYKIRKHPDIGCEIAACELVRAPQHVIDRAFPYGQPGDHLYVKEATWMWCERRPNGVTPTGRQKWRYAPTTGAAVYYHADHPNKPQIGVVSPYTGNQWGWRLKIGRFMPRWASRITLEITGVRVERLQDISEVDAKAEGVFSDEQRPEEHDYKPNAWMCPTCLGTGLHAGLGANGGVIFDIDCRDCETHVQRFKNLWESINGPGSWGANPWVWVVEFRRIERDS